MGRFRRRALGISLDGSQLRWAEVSRCLGRLRVEGSGTLASDALPERAPWRRPDRVIVGLPRQAVAFRWLERPDVDDGHLAGLLAYEVEGHFPFPADEVAYDFLKLRRSGSRTGVLLVGTRKDAVARALAQVEALGVEPTAVDVTSLAAINALLADQRLGAGERGCLVEIEGSEATVSVVSGGALLSSRVLALGDDAGATVADELRRVLVPASAGRPRIFVHGASRDVVMRCEALGVTAEAWRPAGGDVDAAAFGLALRGVSTVPLGIDLLPAERRARRRDGALTVTIALLALIGVLSAVLGLGTAHRERRALHDVDRRLAEAKTRATEVDRLKAEVQRLTTRLEFLDQSARERELPLRMLRELARVLPADTALSEVASDWPRVQIRGTSAASPSGLITALEQSTLFENAAFTSPIAALGDRQGFQLRVSLKGR